MHNAAHVAIQIVLFSPRGGNCAAAGACDHTQPTRAGARNQSPHRARDSRGRWAGEVRGRAPPLARSRPAARRSRVAGRRLAPRLTADALPLAGRGDAGGGQGGRGTRAGPRWPCACQVRRAGRDRSGCLSGAAVRSARQRAAPEGHQISRGRPPRLARGRRAVSAAVRGSHL